MQRTIFFLLTLLYSNFASAERYQNNIPGKIKNFVQSLDDREKQFQGGAIAILYKGEVVYKSTFGHQKGSEGTITSHTLFPLASVSKIVTTTAIALMVDQNRLSLDKEYSLPYLKSKVNLKNILGSTTGYRFSGNQDIEVGMSRKNLLSKLKTLPQPCTPGKCYFYSNLCFSLVSEILEKEHFSLKSAVDELKTILKTDEIVLNPKSDEIDVAYPHIKNRKGEGFVQLPFPPYYPSAVPAAAGIFASIDAMIELYKLQFWYRSDLISSAILEKFYEPYVEADVRHWKLKFPVDSYYGLGWRIFKSKPSSDQKLIFHSGMIGGINTFVGFIPSEETGIIILLNQAPPAASKLGLDFWREFLK